MPQEIGVDNANFLLTRLAADCSPLQWVRELTQNSIEAIQKAVRDGIATKGQVLWDLDWRLYERKKWLKLSIIDTGCGMTDDEMVKNIGHLACSGGVQGLTENYGIGAKIAAFPENLWGLSYTSLKKGDTHASQILIRQDAKTHKFVLADLPLPESEGGGFCTVTKVEIQKLPPEIQEAGHGTVVTLFGNELGDNTFHPKSAERWWQKQGRELETIRWWLIYYLNSKYYRLPPNVEVRVRNVSPKRKDPWQRDAKDVHGVFGQRHYLDSDSQSKGVVDLGEVLAHWWIRPQDKRISGQNRSRYLYSRHVGIIYQDEMYDVDTRLSTMYQFGLGDAAKYCVIYIEPKVSLGRQILPTASRSHLVFNKESAPWDEWIQAFLDKMPQEILDLKKQLDAQVVREDHTEDIRQELEDIRDLFELPTFRSVGGSQAQKSVLGEPQDEADLCDVLELTGADTTGTKGPDVFRSNRSGSKGSTGKELVNGKGVPNGEAQKRRAPLPIPKIEWVKCESLPASDQDEDLLDRAARYDRQPEGNVLRINEDFRLFTGMIDKLKVSENPQQSALVDKVIVDEVRRVYERTLVEVVLGVLSLKGSKHWDHTAMKEALSPRTLTIAVQTRHHQWREARRRIRNVTAKMASQITTEMTASAASE